MFAVYVVIWWSRFRHYEDKRYVQIGWMLCRYLLNFVYVPTNTSAQSGTCSSWAWWSGPYTSAAPAYLTTNTTSQMCWLGCCLELQSLYLRWVWRISLISTSTAGRSVEWFDIYLSWLCWFSWLNKDWLCCLGRAVFGCGNFLGERLKTLR